MLKSIFGKRHGARVNNKAWHRWSLEKVMVSTVLSVIFILLAIVYAMNDYLFDEGALWAELSYCEEKPNWSKDIPEGTDFWIRGDLTIPKGSNDYDALFLGITGNYEVHWDGQTIGKNGTIDNPGKINYYLPLNSNQLSPGKHVVEVKLSIDRSFAKDKLYAGIILGNLRKFSIQPLLQFCCVSVVIGLLLIIWISILTRKGPVAVQLLILSMLLYLILNYAKVLYNYPYPWHAYRLVAYGIANLLLGLSLVHYSLGKAGLIKYRWMPIPIAFILSLIFLITPYDLARYYILFSSITISAIILLRTTRTKKNILVLLAHLYLLLIIQIEVGFLMVIGLIMIIFLEYFKTQTSPVIQKKIDKKLTHLITTYQGVKKLISLAEVSAIKGANNYSEVILENNERYLCDKSLGRIMEEAPGQFIRIHKSYIVDFNRVDSIKTNSSGGKVITLKNQLELPVGRKFSKDISYRLI